MLKGLTKSLMVATMLAAVPLFWLMSQLELPVYTALVLFAAMAGVHDKSFFIRFPLAKAVFSRDRV